jgi:uncharacterized membrane protein
MSIVGFNITSFGFYIPVIWTTPNAKPTQLQLPDDIKYGFAYGINNLGQIVGHNLSDDTSLPVIWSTYTAKPTQLQLPDGITNGFLLDINDLGQIVGFSNINDITSMPLYWANYNAKPTQLQLPDGITSGNGYGINDLGQIVGTSGEGNTALPLIWSTPNAKPTQLQLPDGITNGGSAGINNLGQIVGYGYISGDTSVPLYWSSPNVKPTQLQLPDGITNGFAYDINNLGQIVGVGINDSGNYIPLYWSTPNTKPTPLQLLDGIKIGYATGISDTPVPIPTPPTPTPISNICFPAGTPVQTDQGIIHIDDIDPEIHTINNQPILHITKTTTLDPYLISFDKNSLERNIPSRKTLMTKDHKIMFQDRLVPAYRFLDYSDKVKKVKYSGETLYNILLAQHSTINVNNLICETLHPDNIIAKLYMRKEDIRPLVCQLNSSLENKDYGCYSDVVHRLTHNL